MPRLPDPQRRLVCAQARAMASAARHPGSAKREGRRVGLTEALRMVWPDDAPDLYALAYRIARRFGGRGKCTE